MKLSHWMLVVLISVGLARTGHAAGELKLFANAAMSQTNVTPNPAGITYGGTLGILGGVLLGIGFSNSFGMEFGLVGSPYIEKLTAGTTIIKTTWTMLQTPVGFRVRLGRVVSLGFGGYYAMAAGSTAKVVAEIDGVTAETTSDLSSEVKSDYGAYGGLAFNIPLGKSVSFLLEGRYLHGMKNLTSTEGYKAIMTQIQGFGGLSFML